MRPAAPPSIEVQVWQPSLAPARAAAQNRLSPAWRRAIGVIAVGSLHAAVIAFLLTSWFPDMDFTRTESGSMLAAIIDETRDDGSVETMELGLVDLPPMQVNLPEPHLPDGTLKEPEPVMLPIQDFLPPRLDESVAVNIAEFARRAGVEPGRSRRVILAVTVTEKGIAGDISVTISSGNSRVDALAVEFARALRWSPAMVQGRHSSMNIRLPVVLSTPG